MNNLQIIAYENGKKVSPPPPPPPLPPPPPPPPLRFKSWSKDGIDDTDKTFG